MKTRFCLIISLLFIICFSACASNPSKGKNSTDGVHKEKHQKGKKLLFEDWKYKGFGHELPVWMESAFKNDAEKIKKQVTELAEREIIILSALGINSDQAENLLRQKIADFSKDYKLYDSSWGLLSEKAAAEGNFEYLYFAAAVLYK